MPNRVRTPLCSNISTIVIRPPPFILKGMIPEYLVIFNGSAFWAGDSRFRKNGLPAGARPPQQAA
jgi:hypothetical protein